MTEFTLKPGPKRFVLLFGFAILAFVLGLFLSDSMDMVKPIFAMIVRGVLLWASVILMVSLPIIWLLKRTHIHISEKGIQFNDSRKEFGLIPWSDLGEIQTSRFLFIPVVELYHKNENELLSKISDQKKIKNIELITMISSTPLGINMLFYDQKASDLQRNIEDLRRNDK